MITAFAYLRVSGKGQVDGDGFARQIDAIQRHAGVANIQIVQTFQEKGVSGTTEGMDRPTWVEMIGKVLGNGVRTIVIEKLDRLARDLMIQEHIIQDLRRRGITLISVCEPDLCSDDPTRKLMRQIMGAIAEYDKSMTVLKLRGARTRMRAAEGRCEGRKPYGFREGESVAKDIMAQLRSSGASWESIAEQLNNRGIKPRSGAKWYAASVRRIVTGGR